LPEIVLLAVPVLFLYVPVWVCRWRGIDAWAYPLALPPWAVWRTGALLAGAATLVVLVPWSFVYHAWNTALFGATPDWGRWPGSPLELVGYHLFFVAIPEEVFYRGWLQTRLDELWAPRWRVAGALLGPGWLVATALFAFGHSVVLFQWWHAAIVLPGLLFGWMRARTGDVAAGALFHAACNIAVSALDTVYGIVPP
jgi:membrane protease YdiL (CAAX protease family)